MWLGSFADVNAESGKGGAASGDVAAPAGRPAAASGRDIGSDISSEFMDLKPMHVAGDDSGAALVASERPGGADRLGTGRALPEDRGGPIQGPHGFIHTIVSAARYEVWELLLLMATVVCSSHYVVKEGERSEGGMQEQTGEKCCVMYCDGWHVIACVVCVIAGTVNARRQQAQ